MNTIQPFCFDKGVADCFDDMVFRSVPYYAQIHRILLDILPYQIRAGDCIYDLGCSTGTTLCSISQKLKNLSVRLIGLDQSPFMIAKAKEKCGHCVHPIEFICEDLCGHSLEESGLVIMNYTLQFIPKDDRPKLLRSIYEALRPGGLFFLSEKIESKDRKVQELQRNLYYDFKRKNGYSELEISQKREALENILVPLSVETQLELLRFSGFDHVDMIFRWFNFSCFIGIKKDGP